MTKHATFILMVFLTLTTITKTNACSCIGESTVTESVKSSDLVVAGTIIQTDTESLIDSEMVALLHPDSLQIKKFPYTVTIAKYTVVVGQFFKGKNTSDTITIYTGRGGGDCGYEFKMGNKYLIYGRKKYGEMTISKYDFPSGQNIFWTDICTRTTLFNDKEVNEIKIATNKN